MAERESIRRQNEGVQSEDTKRQRKGEGNYKCGGLRGRDRVREAEVDINKA